MTTRVRYQKPTDSLGRQLPASRRRRQVPPLIAGGKARREHVAAFLGIHVATLDRYLVRDPSFPGPYLIGYGARPTPVWDLGEIEAWLKSKRESPAA